jgi:catechol 2,3-dioxygenase-like lactoylglutathione lyase family enzyme
VIHHVTHQIPPSKLEACVRFYALLGFVGTPKPPGIARHAAWLSHSGTQIHLVPTPGAEAERGHVGVLVEDFSATVAALRSAGHGVEPRREHWGSPRAYVEDPAGNTVELMASPPAGA